jgi:hypothetical protein
MSESYSRRLRWEPVADRGAGLVAPLPERGTQAGLAAARARTARMLSQVGLPTGSTDEARSSPLLEARDLLRAAAEIEHGLLVQYLYAAYSCTKVNTRGPIVQIAKEEMGHLICVQNLILAVGGHPYFGRDEFPTAPTSGGTVFPFPLMLEPLSLGSLAKYVVAESPDLETIHDKALQKRLEPIIAAGKDKAQQAINHVGALYIALYWLFKEDDSAPADWPDYPTESVLAAHLQRNKPNWHISASDFATQQDFEDLQADTEKPGEDWNRGNQAIFVRPVRFLPTGEVDRAGMLQTIFDIAQQGEGWELSDPAAGKSHFMRFLETFESVKALPAGSPAIAAAVPTNPSTLTPSAPGFIANAEANLWGQIFNVRYRITLLKLALAFASRRSLDTGGIDGRAALISDAIGIEMRSNLRTIALQLVQMRRRGTPADGAELLRAAPPFELPDGSLPDLVGLDPDPTVAAAKAITLLRKALADAIDETAGFVKRVGDLPTNLLDSPANRQLLTDIGAADADLRTALG